MFKIRKGQKPAFEEFALRCFEDDTVDHLRDFAPRHSEIVGEAGVRQVIRLGLVQAKRYGFTNCGPVRLYIELMFLFGSYFDTDPLLPWASQTLGNASHADQVMQAMRLFDAANDYIDRVIGRDRVPFVRALRRAFERSREPIPELAPAEVDEFILAVLGEVFPERLTYLGEEPLRALIRRGPHVAEQYGLATTRGMALSIMLAYGHGRGFANDPLFPWIEKTLRDPRPKTIEQRVEWLERRARSYLASALAYLEGEHVNG